MTKRTAETACEVCGETLVDYVCPNDNDSAHDAIQRELWDERGTTDDV